MEPLEWATQIRVAQDELIADAARSRRARDLRTAGPDQAPHAPARHQLTVRHLWWHSAVTALHRLWTPRPATPGHRAKTARNVG